MKDHKGLQSILQYFEVADGMLLFGGRTAEDIASEVGTPFYVYDLGVVGQKVQKLRDALPEDVAIHYAIKANPHPDVIRFFKDHTDGVDVASVGEFYKATEVGVDPSAIGFAGPGKRDHEIRMACEAGIGSLNAESVRELERANNIAGKVGKSLNVSIRVNPAYELVGSGMRMGGGAKQFGIDQEKVPDVLQRFQEWPHLCFVGFHIFAGSQNLRAESINESFAKAFEAIESFLPYCPNKPWKINIGGGLGIPYYANDYELDVAAVGTELQKLLNKYRLIAESADIIIETGRYLVGECGAYICRVVDKKESRGESFLVLDGGMHHNLAASGNLGQVLKRNVPIAVPHRMNEDSYDLYHIVGPLCTPLDRLGTKVRMPVAKEGDLVAIMSSGAYGYSTSPMGFLSHPAPREKVVK